MSEYPILFNGDMVRAILEGRKTMTRRIVKPQPPEWVRQTFGYTCFTPSGCISGRGNYGDQGPAEKFFKCPLGQPGDRLWVRETMACDGDRWWFPDCGGDFSFPTDGKEYAAEVLRWMEKQERFNRLTVPSIHMPRWASRITLEVTSIRIERLCDITDGDAQSEGVDLDQKYLDRDIPYFVPSFRRLWDSIYAKPGCSWSANPWVWVIGFKRMEAGS